MSDNITYRIVYVKIYDLLKNGDDDIYKAIGYPEDMLSKKAELADEDFEYLAKAIALRMIEKFNIEEKKMSVCKHNYSCRYCLKNNICPEYQAQRIEELERLLAHGNTMVIERDQRIERLESALKHAVNLIRKWFVKSTGGSWHIYKTNNPEMKDIVQALNEPQATNDEERTDE